MKVNLVIFNVQFIFRLINETDTIDFSIYALEALLWEGVGNQGLYAGEVGAL